MKMLKDKKNRKLRIISFVILFLAAIVFLAPYFWMLSNSFKSTKEILLEPTNMLPKQFTLDGYVKVITDSPFFRWMGNSLFVTVIDTLVVLFTSSLIGFVLSKYKFKLNKFLFYVILITMMMPTARASHSVRSLTSLAVRRGRLSTTACTISSSMALASA